MLRLDLRFSLPHVFRSLLSSDLLSLYIFDYCYWIIICSISFACVCVSVVGRVQPGCFCPLPPTSFPHVHSSLRVSAVSFQGRTVWPSVQVGAKPPGHDSMHISVTNGCGYAAAYSSWATDCHDDLLKHGNIYNRRWCMFLICSNNSKQLLTAGPARI